MVVRERLLDISFDDGTLCKAMFIWPAEEDRCLTDTAAHGCLLLFCRYGGHIVNDFDRLLANEYLDWYMKDELLDETELYPFAEDEKGVSFLVRSRSLPFLIANTYLPCNHPVRCVNAFRTATAVFLYATTWNWNRIINSQQ